MPQTPDSLAPNFKIASTSIAVYLLVMAVILAVLLFGGR